MNINASSLTINANIVGELKVRLLDASGNEIEGFGWHSITGDDIAHPVTWGKDLKSLSDKPVRIEFRMQHAQLFGFDLN